MSEEIILEEIKYDKVSSHVMGKKSVRAPSPGMLPGKFWISYGPKTR
jgi:hypothetical protein